MKLISLKELRDIFLRAFTHKIMLENLDNPEFDIHNIFKENTDLREIYDASNVKELTKFAIKIFSKS